MHSKYGLEIEIQNENAGHVDLSIGNLIVNDNLIYVPNYIPVEGSVTEKIVIDLFNEEMDREMYKGIAKVEMEFWVGGVVEKTEYIGTVELETELIKDYSRVVLSSGDVMLMYNGVWIYGEIMDDSDIDGPVVRYYIMNDSDTDLRFGVYDSTVNGEFVRTQFGSLVVPIDTSVLIYERFYGTDMENAGITEIESVGLQLNFYDNFSDMLLHQTEMMEITR